MFLFTFAKRQRKRTSGERVLSESGSLSEKGSDDEPELAQGSADGLELYKWWHSINKLISEQKVLGFFICFIFALSLKKCYIFR